MAELKFKKKELQSTFNLIKLLPELKTINEAYNKIEDFDPKKVNKLRDKFKTKEIAETIIRTAYLTGLMDFNYVINFNAIKVKYPAYLKVINRFKLEEVNSIFTYYIRIERVHEGFVEERVLDGEFIPIFEYYLKQLALVFKENNIS